MGEPVKMLFELSLWSEDGKTQEDIPRTLSRDDRMQFGDLVTFILDNKLSDMGLYMYHSDVNGSSTQEYEYPETPVDPNAIMMCVHGGRFNTSDKNKILTLASKKMKIEDEDYMEIRRPGPYWFKIERRIGPSERKELTQEVSKLVVQKGYPAVIGDEIKQYIVGTRPRRGGKTRKTRKTRRRTTKRV